MMPFEAWAYLDEDSWEYGEVGGDESIKKDHIEDAMTWGIEKLAIEQYWGIEIINSESKQTLYTRTRKTDWLEH